MVVRFPKINRIKNATNLQTALPQAKYLSIGIASSSEPFYFCTELIKEKIWDIIIHIPLSICQTH